MTKPPQRALREGCESGEVGIAEPGTRYALRHSGVYPALCGTTYLLEDGYDLSACTAQAGIRTVQELLGHKDMSTMMIDTHVLNRGRRPSAAQQTG